MVEGFVAEFGVAADKSPYRCHHIVLLQSPFRRGGRLQSIPGGGKGKEFLLEASGIQITAESGVIIYILQFCLVIVEIP